MRGFTSDDLNMITQYLWTHHRAIKVRFIDIYMDDSVPHKWFVDVEWYDESQIWQFDAISFNDDGNVCIN